MTYDTPKNIFVSIKKDLIDYQCQKKKTVIILSFPFRKYILPQQAF